MESSSAGLWLVEGHAPGELRIFVCKAQARKRFFSELLSEAPQQQLDMCTQHALMLSRLSAGRKQKQVSTQLALYMSLRSTN
jgi:hypothetical protein